MDRRSPPQKRIDDHAFPVRAKVLVPERGFENLLLDMHRWLDAYADYVEQPGIFARLRLAVADHRAYLATCDELNALSDCELADLGLSRLNVRTVAREAVYRN